MESPTVKRGVYPLHGFKLGLYRLPFKLDDPLEIKSIHDGLKKAFEMEIYADRVLLHIIGLKKICLINLIKIMKRLT